MWSFKNNFFMTFLLKKSLWKKSLQNESLRKKYFWKKHVWKKSLRKKYFWKKSLQKKSLWMKYLRKKSLWMRSLQNKSLQNQGVNFNRTALSKQITPKEMLIYLYDKLIFIFVLSLVLLLIINLTNELCLHQFLASKTT